MCGIAGWIDFNGGVERNEQAEDMLCSMKRRGPDDSGTYIDFCATLLHTRLAVIDPERGKQPMTIEAKGENYTIVYNGELYNTEEIRAMLLALGYTFDGHSDTEVLLNAFIEWGENCLQRLNGIFAFAVWKKNRRELFIARDRIGVKPLFYYQYQGGIIFASEIKTLMKSKKIKPHLDKAGVQQLLLLGPGRSMGSGVIKGVRELETGTYITFNDNFFKKRSYWALKAMPHTEDLETTIEHTKSLVTDSVNRQLVSDVPLACFLSGGLDSSIISQIAANEYKKKNRELCTFSVCYENNEKYFQSNSFQPESDDKYIDLMSRFIGSNHRNIELNAVELGNSLDEATDARDLPGMADIDSSLLLFSRNIKKYTTVCLSGECADEIFGGYPWYHKEEILYNDTFPWSNSILLRKKLFKKEFIGSDSEDFVHSEYERTVHNTSYLDTDSKYERRMREMFMLNFYWFMQTLLDRKDRMTMYSGLEVRVPFCDHRLVEYAYNMPWNYKSLNGREKGILREAFKDQLPAEITFRKKSPYPKTFDPAFMDFVKTKLIAEYEQGILQEIVNKDFLIELLSGAETISQPWYGQLMRLPQIYAYLLQIDSFFKKFKINII